MFVKMCRPSPMLAEVALKLTQVSLLGKSINIYVGIYKSRKAYDFKGVQNRIKIK